MIKIVKKLYEETYSPKLTPELLVSNLTLDNYTKINFEKVHGILEAHVFCFLEDHTEAEYIYKFKDNLLIKLESNIDNIKETIYCREKEKQKILDQINYFKEIKKA
ncbi:MULTISPECIES: hypothetical protein [Bacillus cereus group]|uniref:hypothetical protein n=1 Tax=Bacillus cereus group TaxID=86661 RepID=UPI000279EEDD|nr:hypothetical protein [Bacillus cereus]EJR28513.1 hypothetical protein IIE_05352 [Bacillus cereus VD045]HDR4351113.1 hypothetical protein [Bacillus cereus]HDR6958074.1 hypothetical protein [Bacillus cereus]